MHKPSLRKPLPEIPGLVRVKDFEAAFNRKLYVFSAGHVTVAYLGFLKGYRYVHAAVRDPEVRTAALEAMREGQQGLAARATERRWREASRSYRRSCGASRTRR